MKMSLDLDAVTEALQETIRGAIRAYDLNSPRSIQSQEGLLGMSDLGFCRQKALLTVRQVEDSDERDMQAAQWGTAIHAYLDNVWEAYFPEFIVLSQKLLATFPSGATIPGTPDVVGVVTIEGVRYFVVIDVKSKDGLEKVKRDGPSQNDRFQRHGYALAAVQAGLNADGLPVLVFNLYIDRAGRAEPLLIGEEFDESLTMEIDAWVQDVIYARKHNEDASRDIPAPVCERICEKFTACRGHLEVYEGEILIEDPSLISSLRMYVEGGALKKQGDQMQKEAKRDLAGINGSDGEIQVRWTRVNETEVSGFMRAAYDRVDVRRINKGRQRDGEKGN